MAGPTDVNVDDLKRRARRRLVGAIVLALAVAVFVPMLLESDPKPLGEDVSVRIPPVDEGKFVNRLNDAGKAGQPKGPVAKSEARAESKPDATKTETAKAEPAKAEAPKSEMPRPETAVAAPANEPVVAAAPAPTPAATPPVAMPAAAPAATPSAPPAPAPAASAAASTTNPPASGEHALSGFSVQLAAFSDAYGANALTNKLKKAGFPAYTEPLTTAKGTLWRVRVGPFPSREAAASSRDKLKGEGYSGIVAAAK
ncbi:MAG: SPOR domain-containing protein [Casimicrobiaceae bacterium]